MQQNTDIFHGIPQKERSAFLQSLMAERRSYLKGAMLLGQGEENRYICVLESGKAHAVRYAPDGRETDFALLREGDLFGDALALSRNQRSPVSVYADTDCTVMRFLYQILTASSHPYAQILLQNLAEQVSLKFFRLQKRVHYLTRPSLREKLLSYLYDCMEEVGSPSFTLSLDRSALSSYLYCDRSALCRELSRMQKEGLMRYHGRQVCLLPPADSMKIRKSD